MQRRPNAGLVLGIVSAIGVAAGWLLHRQAVQAGGQRPQISRAKLRASGEHEAPAEKSAPQKDRRPPAAPGADDYPDLPDVKITPVVPVDPEQAEIVDAARPEIQPPVILPRRSLIHPQRPKAKPLAPELTGPDRESQREAARREKLEEDLADYARKFLTQEIARRAKAAGVNPVKYVAPWVKTVISPDGQTAIVYFDGKAKAPDCDVSLYLDSARNKWKVRFVQGGGFGSFSVTTAQ